jgi:hypothetical protein
MKADGDALTPGQLLDARCEGDRFVIRLASYNGALIAKPRTSAAVLRIDPSSDSSGWGWRRLPAQYLPPLLTSPRTGCWRSRPAVLPCRGLPHRRREPWASAGGCGAWPRSASGGWPSACSYGGTGMAAEKPRAEAAAGGVAARRTHPSSRRLQCLAPPSSVPLVGPSTMAFTISNQR